MSLKFVIAAEYINPKSNTTAEYFHDIIQNLCKKGYGVKLIYLNNPENNEACETLCTIYSNITLEPILASESTQGISLSKLNKNLFSSIKIWKKIHSIIKPDDYLLIGTNQFLS